MPKTVVDGLLLLDKPAGISSNGALQRARWLFGGAKAGHTGTLDPFATGLLPICFGEATKFSAYGLEAAKTYEARLKLGYTSSTGDTEGEIRVCAPVVVDEALVDAVLLLFLGPQLQTPPMHSAVKYNGQPLYSYAREGQTIEREARNIAIFALKRLSLVDDVLSIRVRCSKGTYIRVLGEAIGHSLQCGAYLLALRRIALGALEASDAMTLAEIECIEQSERAARLLPVESLACELTALNLDSAHASALRDGRAVPAPDAHRPGLARLYEAGTFMGLGEVTAERMIVVKRLIASLR
jgi:tRNA pseudouridine55 synthase